MLITFLTYIFLTFIADDECFLKEVNQGSLHGKLLSSMTVDDCKEDCRNRDDCVGVDFDSANKCWYHTESTIGNTYTADYVDQYKRTCEPGRIGLYLGLNMNTADKTFIFILSIHGRHKSKHTHICRTDLCFILKLNLFLSIRYKKSDRLFDLKNTHLT